MKKFLKNKAIIAILAIYSVTVTCGYFYHKTSLGEFSIKLGLIHRAQREPDSAVDIYKGLLSEYSLSKKELSQNLLLSSMSGTAFLPIAIIELGAQIKEDYIFRLISLKSAAFSSVPLKQIINYLVLELDYELNYEQKRKINFAITHGLDIGGSIAIIPESQITYLTKILKLKGGQND